MKVGRNDLCPCGSGKKFKKCCLNEKYDKSVNLILSPGLLKPVREAMNQPEEPFEKGGFLTGRPFIDTIFQGNRFRAVGHRLCKRPVTETFHEFVLNIFAEASGAKWFAEEKLKQEADRHIMANWYTELTERIRENKNPDLPEDYLFSIKQSGNIRSLLALSYDFYSLFHCGAKTLPGLLNRLKNKDNFQGARYEIAVGGLAVRAGFDIKWINLKEKHCEFIGIHKVTKDKGAFEAKSHHREGVLGISGNDFDPEKARIKIVDHLREALGQAGEDVSLVVFDDLNLPITSGADILEKRWFKEGQDSLVKYDFLKNYQNTNFGALFLTNFSWHFHKEIENHMENEVAVLFHAGNKYSLNPETIRFLKLAVEQYGFVPPKL